MLVRYFRQNQPAVLILLLPLLLLLWPGASPVPDPLSRLAPGMPGYAALRILFEQGGWVLPVVACALVAVLALQLNFTFNESELFERRNHLPALLLPLVLGLFPCGLVPDAAFAGMPFALWAMRRLWATQGDVRLLGPLFDAGLLIGLAAVCYLPYAFLVVVLWSSLAVMRPFHWREYLVPLVGLALMLFLVWGALHLLAPGAWSPAASWRPRIAPGKAPAPHWLRGVLITALALILLVAGISVFAGGYARGIMREKNTRASYLAFAFTCGLLSLFNWLVEGRVPAALVAVPVSTFLSWPLLQARRVVWAEMAVIALIALGAWGRWG